MAAYDYVTFTPQASAPASPAKNEIYYDNATNRLKICPDGAGAGGGAYDYLEFVPQASAPTAARGRVYLGTDGKFHLCTAT